MRHMQMYVTCRTMQLPLAMQSCVTFQFAVGMWALTRTNLAREC